MIRGPFVPLGILIAIIVLAELLAMLGVSASIRWTVELVAVLLCGWWYLNQKNNEKETKAAEAFEAESAAANAEVDQLFQQLATDIREESGEVDTELERSTNLINDATQTLSGCFSQMTELVQLQEEQAREIYQRTAGHCEGEELGHGANQMNSFAQEAEGMLEEFITLLVNISKQSLEAVHHIDDMVEQLDGVFDLISNVEDLSGQTNLLALNASIEAARAGDMGRGFAVVADEVRTLSIRSTELNQQVREKINKAKDAVSNVRTTVGEMASTDMNASLQSKERVDAIFQQVSETNEFLTGTVQEMSNTTDQFGQVVGNAVRSLQFDDMVTQNIGTAREHLQCLIGIGNQLTSAAGQSSLDAEKVANLRQQLEQLRSSYADSQRKKVLSESMDEGDVELF
ncbi:MAG: methyl-accepting chemotaxis protein [Motiliproteus sp.]|nr:methyl-accepting chemotaxis protein [Motiliproteus sp.]MCW9053051.1 methyl-accepting chemotaxis protein [Motiliproteus sp.]